MKKLILMLCIEGILLHSCANNNTEKSNDKKIDKTTDKMEKGTYGYDKEFLNTYYKSIELKMGDAALLLIPELQGRVMTSTCNGNKGFSFGWINYDLISSKKLAEHFNPCGGEERFWIGPEGGQFSIYFAKDKAFEFENWYVPAGIDTEAFNVLSKSETEVSFQKEMHLTNYSDFKFDIDVTRQVKLLDKDAIASNLNITTADLSVVAYESSNSIENIGKQDWKDETGKLSIWMLGMMTPSPEVTVVIPIKSGEEKDLGVVVNDDYFGKVSSDRLKVINNTVYFKADGKSRGKIGIPPLRTAGFMGSYDAQNNILTILQCELPEYSTKYVNSAWKLQDNPYGGDAFNSYNDGPLEDGSQMGPFYELETSSPALSLKPLQAYTHLQRTYHFKGNKQQLNAISKKILNVTIEEIEKVF